MRYAPIAIFACRRPNHLKELLNSLKLNPEAVASDLKIYIGGPKYKKDWESVEETIKVAEEVCGFKSIAVEKRFSAKTGSALIHMGVGEVLEKHSSLIVLEDDLVVKENFLCFMNESLERFKNDERVSQISGWNYGTISKRDHSATYLFPVPTPWGWATWRRAWNEPQNFNGDFAWLIEKSHRIHNFNFKENYDCLGMIEAVINENYDAWDAVWYLHLFRNSKLVVHPNHSLVINRGFDGSGLNFRHAFRWKDTSINRIQTQFTFSHEIAMSPEFAIYLRYLRKWIEISENQTKVRLFFNKIVRKYRQHRRYYRKHFYIGK